MSTEAMEVPVRHRQPLRAPCGRSTTSIIAIVAAAMVFGSANAMATVGPTLSGAVANSATLPGVTAVAVSGSYAYVTGYYTGRLVAVDISNPAEPVIAGESEASEALVNATTVNIAGGYAYVVSKNRNGSKESGTNEDGTGNSLTVLDITTTPASPTIVGSLHDTDSLFGAYGVAVSGGYAYVAAQGCLSGQPCPEPAVGNAFAVIDISDPAFPTLAATLHDTSLPSPWAGTGAFAHATAVAISGSYAYVTASAQDRLTVVDVANPLAPEIVASLKDTTNLSSAVDVAVSGQYAYVADQTSPGRVSVVDVSNPADPKIVTSLASSSLNGAYRIRLRGDFAYVSAFSGADAAVLDISDPLNPRLVASVADGTHLNKTSGLDLDQSGGYLIASSPFLSSQTQPLYPPFALQSGGPTLTGTVSVITLDPSPIAVSIEPGSQPTNPTAQTSAAFSFSTDDTVSTVQCQLDSGAWLPCATPTSQSYEALADGSHVFAVRATDAAGNTSTASYSWTIATPVTNNEGPPPGGTAPGTSTTASTATSASTAGNTVAGLTDTQIAALLAAQLTPTGKSAAIGSLLHHDGLSMSIKTPEAGRLTLDWYELPPGARLAKGKPKPVLIATAAASAHTATAVALKIELTALGKRLLKRSRRIKLTAVSTFTPATGGHVTASRTFLLTAKR